MNLILDKNRNDFIFKIRKLEILFIYFHLCKCASETSKCFEYLLPMCQYWLEFGCDENRARQVWAHKMQSIYRLIARWKVIIGMQLCAISIDLFVCCVHKKLLVNWNFCSWHMNSKICAVAIQANAFECWCWFSWNLNIIQFHNAFRGPHKNKQKLHRIHIIDAWICGSMEMNFLNINVFAFCGLQFCHVASLQSRSKMELSGFLFSYFETMSNQNWFEYYFRDEVYSTSRLHMRWSKLNQRDLNGIEWHEKIFAWNIFYGKLICHLKFDFMRKNRCESCCQCNQEQTI